MHHFAQVAIAVLHGRSVSHGIYIYIYMLYLDIDTAVSIPHCFPPPHLGSLLRWEWLAFGTNDGEMLAKLAVLLLAVLA